MSEDLTHKLPKTDSDKLNEILTRVNGIDSRLEQLEHTVAERLHDTRPIWHKMVADIGELQSSQKRLEASQKRFEEGQHDLRSEIRGLNSAVREVNRDQIVINDSLRKIQLDLLTFDERLHKCEINRRQNSST